MYDDIEYDVDPEDCHIDAASMTSAFFKRNNVKVHKFLKSLTQDTEAYKWIENSKGGSNAIKSLREHYTGSGKGEHHMNITEASMKELYFKSQEVFPFEKYVNRLKESYNTLDELNQPKFK